MTLFNLLQLSWLAKHKDCYKREKSGNNNWFYKNHISNFYIWASDNRYHTQIIGKEKGDCRYTLRVQLHRLDGPAIIWVDGSQEWFQKGRRHRLDGPAYIWANGSQRWYINGKNYSEQEFKSRKV